MNVTRHFSDTRTEQGRVRFLIQSGRVSLVAEGPGWQHESLHANLQDAALYLALVTGVPGELYRRALDDLDRQVQFEAMYRGAA